MVSITALRVATNLLIGPHRWVLHHQAAGVAVRHPGSAYADLPVPGSAPSEGVSWGAGKLAFGSLNFDAPKKQGTEKFTDNWQVSPAVTATAPDVRSPGCSTRSSAFTDTVHMSGTTTVTVKLALNKPAANRSVYLVKKNYDSARIGTSGQVGTVMRGWAYLFNYKSLTKAGDYHSKTPGRRCPVSSTH